MMPGRVFEIARLRFREAIRGTFPAYVVLFLLLSVAITLLAPGDPGKDRQRTVDALGLKAVFLVTALAAAAFGASSLPADREAGRKSRTDATLLSPWSLLAGGFFGQVAAIAVLLLFCVTGFLAVTAALSGGDRDRSVTRTPIHGKILLDSRGRRASGPVALTRASPDATFLLPASRSEIARAAGPGGFVDAYVDLVTVLDIRAGIPYRYPVVVRVGDGPTRRIEVGRKEPLVFRIRPKEVRLRGETRVQIRRIDPRVGILLHPGGLTVEGPPRLFGLNVLAAGFAWLLALAIVIAAATAFSTFVGAPVATAGTLLVLLVGYSLADLREATAWLVGEGGTSARIGHVLDVVLRPWPDFGAMDLGHVVTARWAIAPGDVLSHVPVAVLTALAFLVVAGIVLFAGRWR